MPISKIMIAVAALSAGHVMAATAPANIAISSGASASKNNLKIVLQSLCGSNTFTEYTDGTSNVSTYVCSTGGTDYASSSPVNFTGTAFAELRMNVNGGSFTAACLLANWPAGTSFPVADQYWDPAAAGMAAAPTGSVVVGGLMDVEPTAFLQSVRSGITTPTSVISAKFGQAFGVAVSGALYSAMFADQQSKLGQGCTETAYSRPECVPVIGKAQMATIMAGGGGNAAYVKGANFLAPSQLAAGTQLTYARRVDTSGTQASAQQYFLGNVCNTNGITVVGAGASAGAITVTALPTTGGVRTLLNTAGSYVVGIMSGENNQSGQTWKWVRVGGMHMAESALPNDAAVTFSNTATALDGRYDYWFLSRVAKPNVTAVNNFWTAVINGFANVPVANTKGLFGVAETAYTRGTSSACQPITSN